MRLVINRRPERQTQTWRVQTIVAGWVRESESENENERGRKTHGSTSDVVVMVVRVLGKWVGWLGWIYKQIEIELSAGGAAMEKGE